jgi:MFS family permease
VPQRAETRPDPIASLRHASFLIFLLASLLSNTGNQMRTAAVGWEVYHREREPIALGYIGLVLALPVILLALPAGAAADRWSRRKIIMAAQAGLAASGCGLAWASWSHASIGWVYFFLLGTGVFRALGWPASTAIVVSLVPNNVFPNAVMWRSVGFQLAATVGPLVGGLLLAWWEPVIVYLIDAASSFVMMVALAFIRPRAYERKAEPRSWQSIVEGVRFLRRHPLLLSTMVLDMVAVLFGGVTAMLPAFASDVLGVGATGFGWMRAMPSVGAICMSLMLATRPPMKRSGMALLWAVVAFGVATIIFGVSKSFPLSLACLFLLGAADNISVVIRSTVLQLLTPDSMRGRVSAVSIIFIGTSNEIGEFESGVAAQWLGLVPSVVLGGGMTLVTVAAVARFWPELRAMGSLEHLSPPEQVAEVVAG